MSNRGLGGIRRRDRICELLLADGYVDVSKLSEELKVNLVTIRRDLDRLERAGLLRRSHGGAYPRQAPVGAELDFSLRMNYHLEVKQRIARRVARLLYEGDTVYLDAGTTALMVAREIANRRHLSVVTHSLEVVEALKSSLGINLFLIGGQYLRHTHSMVGYQAEEAIRGFRCRKLVLGTAGIDFQGRALTLSAAEEVPMKRAAIACAEQVLLVADAGKFDKSSLHGTIPLSDVDVLISDAAPSPEAKVVLDELGIDLLLA